MIEPASPITADRDEELLHKELEDKVRNDQIRVEARKAYLQIIENVRQRGEIDLSKECLFERMISNLDMIWNQAMAAKKERKIELPTVELVDSSSENQFTFSDSSEVSNTDR